MNPQLTQRWRRAQDDLAHQRFAEAISGWEGVLAEQPGHVSTLLWLARTHAQAGHYRRSRECALQALAQQPQEPEAAFELIQRLGAFNEAAALLGYVNRLDFDRWRDLSSLVTTATLLCTLGAFEPAASIVARVLGREPQHAAALYLRASLAMFDGRIEQAEEDLERCIALAPQYAPAHWTLSQLHKQGDDRNHVERLRRQLAKAASGGPEDIYLSFALHNELYDLGRFDEAWSALQHACQAKRQRLRYDRAETARLFEQIRSLCTTGFCRGQAERSDCDLTPIFIVGMHRSGTTVLERILGGHSRIADAGETYAFPAQMRLATDHRCAGPIDAVIVERAAGADFRAVGAGYLAQSRWRARGQPYVTDKLPSNFLNLGFIAKALPQARFLHLVRDPRDVCFSNLRMFFSEVNGYSYDQLELAEYYAHYRELMAHWHDVLPGRVLDVRYDELVSDSEAATRRIMAFLGLPFEAETLAIERRAGAVATASSVQVRQGIRAPGAPAWKPYEVELQPLFDALSRWQGP